MSQTIDVSNAVAPVKQSRRWQFSIKSTLILMSVCCAFFACCAAPPLGIIGTSIFGVCLFVYCVIATFYGRGWIRPFGIICGLSMPLCFLILVEASPRHGAEIFLMMLVLTFVSMAIGLFGATVHGYLTKRMGIVPIPNVPLLRNWLHNPEPEPFEVK